MSSCKFYVVFIKSYFGDEWCFVRSIMPSISPTWAAYSLWFLISTLRTTRFEMKPH